MGTTHICVEEEVMVDGAAVRGEVGDGRQEHQMGITHQHITPQELYGVQGVSREHVDLVIVVGHCQDRDVCQDPVISPSRP